MKKFFVLVLAVMMTGLVACGEGSSDVEKNTKWETTSDAQTFAESAAFHTAFYFRAGGDYEADFDVDWSTGEWTFVANQYQENVGHSGSGFRFDEYNNIFILEKTTETGDVIYFYSAYDEATNTYTINYYTYWGELCPIIFRWTPNVKFVSAE